MFLAALLLAVLSDLGGRPRAQEARGRLGMSDEAPRPGLRARIDWATRRYPRAEEALLAVLVAGVYWAIDVRYEPVDVLSRATGQWRSLALPVAGQVTRFDPLVPWLARCLDRDFVDDRGQIKSIAQTRYLRLMGEMVQIADWFDAARPDLDRYDVEQALEASDRWHQLQREAASGRLAVPGEKIKTWPDGWTAHRLVTRDQLQSEGQVMGHCVGGGNYVSDVSRGATTIYSLRDSAGRSLATVQVTGRKVNQALGPGNRELKPAVARRVDELLADVVAPVDSQLLLRMKIVAEWSDREWANRWTLRSVPANLLRAAYDDAPWPWVATEAAVPHYLLTRPDGSRAAVLLANDPDDPESWRVPARARLVQWTPTRARPNARMSATEFAAVERAFRYLLDPVAPPREGQLLLTMSDDWSWSVVPAPAATDFSAAEGLGAWLDPRPTTTPAPYHVEQLLREPLQVYLALTDPAGLPMMLAGVNLMEAVEEFDPAEMDPRRKGSRVGVRVYRGHDEYDKGYLDRLGVARAALRDWLNERPRLIRDLFERSHPAVDAPPVSPEEARQLVTTLKVEQAGASKRKLDPEMHVPAFVAAVHRGLAWASARGLPGSWVEVDLSGGADRASQSSPQPASYLRYTSGQPRAGRRVRKESGAGGNRYVPRLVTRVLTPPRSIDERAEPGRRDGPWWVLEDRLLLDQSSAKSLLDQICRSADVAHQAITRDGYHRRGVCHPATASSVLPASDLGRPVPAVAGITGIFGFPVHDPALLSALNQAFTARGLPLHAQAVDHLGSIAANDPRSGPGLLICSSTP